jgi:MFS superfamily sulfate permease-like transporter
MFEIKTSTTRSVDTTVRPGFDDLSTISAVRFVTALADNGVLAGCFVSCMFYLRLVSRAIAQAVSRRLPTAAARVMDKSGAGAGFLRELRFLLQIYIPSASPKSSSLSPEAGTIGQEWPQCQ